MAPSRTVGERGIRDDADRKPIEDPVDIEFQRLSNIDPNWLGDSSLSRMRKTSIFYVSKRFYTVSTYLFYTCGEIYFSDPFRLYRFGQIMLHYGRAQQIGNLILEIDLTAGPRINVCRPQLTMHKHGEPWSRLVPDIAPVFTGLRTLSIIFLEIHEKWSWHNQTTFIDRYPHEEEPDLFWTIRRGLKRSLRGGKFTCFISGNWNDEYREIRDEMDEEGKNRPNDSWGEPWPWNHLGLHKV